MKKIRNLSVPAGVLQIISAVLWFVPLYKITDEKTDNIYSMINCLNETEISTVVIIASMIGMVVSLVLILMPVIRKTNTNIKLLIFPIITAVYSAAMTVWALLNAYMPAQAYNYEVSVQFGAILLIVVSIALIALLSVMSVKAKKASK